MRSPRLLTFTLLAVAAGHAVSACTPLRFGYTDQVVAPYYLGSGAQEGDPPGALAELTREAVANGGCAIVMVRMPPARLRMSLEAGAIDATSLFSPEVVGPSPQIVYPLDKQGRPDTRRGMHLYSVVFVRAEDHLPIDGDPAKLLHGRIIGVSHGAPHIKALRKLGVEVDDGAANPDLNFEKLRRHRIDGFAISISAQDDMDASIASRYGKRFVRLNKPLITTTAWLALNKHYYDTNRAHADAMWDWYGSRGAQRISVLLKKYEK